MMTMRKPHASRPLDTLALMRPLRFTELMELLEFSQLRLDEPAAGHAPGVIGVQDWWCGPAPPASPDLYVCSTLGALRSAILPPANAQLHIEIGPREGVSLQVVQPGDQPPRQPCLLVDLPGLIQGVLVPAHAPSHLYALIRHVVMTRLWVEVSRV